MEVESGKTHQDKATLESGKMGNHKALELTSQNLMMYTRDNFKIHINKDSELKDITMARHMSANIERIVLMEKENTFGQMEIITRENSLIT